jgi:hypothetical protein
MTDACHEHNRSRPPPIGPRTWGIRLSLPEGDPMRPLLGDDWHQYHWFASEAERETRLAQLRGQFIYYRKGDKPSFIIERVNRASADAG